jgi:tetraacyldisaccharide 4'-kinase
MRLRNWRYDTRRAKIHRVGVPVISVGNLTLGGTGKTPTVEWLARWLRAHGLGVALVSRGYGAEHGQPNDEARELAEKLPGVPHVLDADRVRGAQRAIDEHHCQAILLDDGYQHRRLHRDLNIVLIDASEPCGFGHVFPRGMLRESLQGWSRADVAILTRSELVGVEDRGAIRAKVRRYSPGVVWVEASYVPQLLRAPDGREQPLSHLAGQRVAAFCGIGNPASFRHALDACDYQIAGWSEFDDHHAYTPSDAEFLTELCTTSGATAALCTHKDLVKISTLWSSPAPLWALQSQLQITVGQAELEVALRRVLSLNAP